MAEFRIAKTHTAGRGGTTRRALTSLLLGALLAIAMPRAGHGGARNLIRGVDVSGEGEHRTVAIHTSATPTFTVFRLSNPMRIVVDLSGADLSRIDGPIDVDDGVIEQIATRQFASDGFQIARIIVGFERELTYDVRAEGKAVVIRTGNAPLSAVQRALPPPVAPVDRVAAERFEQAKKEADVAAKRAREERRGAEAAARQAELKQADARKLAAQAEGLNSAAEHARAQAEALRLAAKESAAAQRVQAERKAQEAEARQRQLEARAREISESRAAAERLAVNAKQAQRDAEEAAARAEARHKQQVADLQQRIAAAEQEEESARKARTLAEAARQEAERAEAQAREAQRTAENTRSQNVKRLHEIAAREEKARDLFAKVQDGQRSVKQQRQQLRDERRKIDERAGEIADNARRVEQQKRKLSASQSAIVKQQKAMEGRSAALAKKKTELGKGHAEVIRMRQEVDVAKSRLDADRKAVSSERARLKRERSELERKRAAAKADAAAVADARVARLQAKLDETRRMVREKSRALKAKQKRISKLEARKDSRTTSGSERAGMADLEAERRRLETLEAEHARLLKSEAEHARVAKQEAQNARVAQREAAQAKRDAAAAREAAKENELAAAQARRDTATAREAARKIELAAAKQRRRHEASLGGAQAPIAANRTVSVDALVAEPAPQVQLASTNSALRSSSAKTFSTPARLTGIARRGSGAQGGVLLAMNRTAAYETELVEDPPRLVIDLKNTRRSTKRLVYGVRDPLVKRVRLGDHGKDTRVVFDLNTAGAVHTVKPSAGGLLVSMRAPTKSELAARSTSVTEAAPLASPPSVPAGDTVKDIQFSVHDGAARVVVDLGSAQAGRAALSRVRVDDRSKKAWVLEIDRMTLPKPLERSLDTAAYGAVVRMVSSYQARAGTVKVVANLSGAASYKLKQEGSSLIWEIAAKKERKGSSGRKSGGGAVASSAPQTAGFAAEAQVFSRSTPTQSRKRRISIDLKDADIVNVIRLLADVSGENIITSDQVSGKITLRLRNVPWDKALDTILKTKGYDKVRHNNILRIAPADMIAKERERDIERKKARIESEKMLIKIITVNYAVAGDIVGQLTPVLSTRGSAQVDERSNSIIVEEVASNIDRLVQLTQQLDRQTPQVLIEARIVEASSNFLETLGVQWGGIGQATAAAGNATGLAFPGQIIASGAADDSNTITSGVANPSNYAVNLPAPIGAGSGGGIGFVFGSAGGSQLLNLRLSAMEENGSGRIISSPRITTLDNRTATISQGVDIPISVVSAAGVNTRFIPARLVLEVTPHVTNDGSVLMKIKTSKNQPDFSQLGASGDPTIINKEANTEVLVRDGNTTVIGGIYTRTKSEVVSEVPILGKIPVLGWLFKNRRMEDRRTELLIFVTPRIINREASIFRGGSMNSISKDDGK